MLRRQLVCVSRLLIRIANKNGSNIASCLGGVACDRLRASGNIIGKYREHRRDRRRRHSNRDVPRVGIACCDRADKACAGSRKAFVERRGGRGYGRT